MDKPPGLGVLIYLRDTRRRRFERVIPELTPLAGVPWENYERWIVSTRYARPIEILDYVRVRCPEVICELLDREEAFEQAHDRCIDSMAAFRRWLARYLGENRWLWWLTNASFVGRDYTLFDMFLCLEKLASIQRAHPDHTIVCYLVSDNPFARLVEWPVPVEVIAPHRHAFLGALLWTFVGIPLDIARAIHQALRRGFRHESVQSEIGDVCFIVRNALVRNMNYADLPNFLTQQGLKVSMIKPPREIGSPEPEGGPFDAQYSVSLLNMGQALLLTATLFVALLRAVITSATRPAVSAWVYRALVYDCLTNQRSLFCLLRLYYATVNFFSRHPTKVVVFTLGVYDLGRTIALALRSLPADRRPVSIELQHALVCKHQPFYRTDAGDPDMPFPTCDRFLAYNLTSKQTYDSLSQPGTREPAVITGMHRVQAPHHLQLDVAHRSMLAGLDRERPIFLLLGSIWDVMRPIWACLCNVSRTVPIQLIVKTHPAAPLPQDAIARFGGADGSRVYYSEAFDLAQVVSVSDWVLTPSTTAVIDAILQRKQIIYLMLDERCDGNKIDSALAQSPDVIFITKVSKLGDLLRELSQKKPSGPADYDRVIEALVPLYGGASLQAMYEEIARMVDGGRKEANGVLSRIITEGRGVKNRWKPVA